MNPVLFRCAALIARMGVDHAFLIELYKTFKLLKMFAWFDFRANGNFVILFVVLTVVVDFLFLF